MGPFIFWLSLSLRPRPVASFLITGWGSRFLQIFTFFRVQKLEFPAAVSGKPRFLKTIIWSKLWIYMPSIFNIINSILQTNDIQDISSRTVGRKVTF